MMIPEVFPEITYRELGRVGISFNQLFLRCRHFRQLMAHDFTYRGTAIHPELGA